MPLSPPADRSWLEEARHELWMVMQPQAGAVQAERQHKDERPAVPAALEVQLGVLLDEPDHAEDGARVCQPGRATQRAAEHTECDDARSERVVPCVPVPSGGVRRGGVVAARGDQEGQVQGQCTDNSDGRSEGRRELLGLRRRHAQPAHSQLSRADKRGEQERARGGHALHRALRREADHPAQSMARHGEAEHAVRGEDGHVT
mmetsp:Transcript_3588/g.10175  ORF Transcript_3588/g.10175 Transcript_3588/m.10175 type:complete len:203 (-) Transcript_3588:1629-2237(-)